MKMKATKFSLLGILSMLLVFTACQDDFTEQDLLQLQADLAEQAAANDHQRALAEIAALHANALAEIAASGLESRATEEANDALNRAYQEFYQDLIQARDDENRETALNILRSTGYIADYTVRLEDNGRPVEGGTVALGIGTSRDTLTTDANGEVTFVDVPAAVLTVDLIASGYISMRYTSDMTTGIGGSLQSIDIGTYNYQVADQRHELITVQMLSSTSTADMATIKGTVTGNVDLTSEDPEALAGIAVEARVEGDFTLISDAVGNTVTNITFGPYESFGKDTTDANGDYSLSVPAYVDLDGTSIAYVVAFPSEISADQTLAYVDGDSARITTTPATWGPYAMDVTEFPFVYGYQTDYNEPPSAGSGFAISTPTKVGRGLATDEWDDIFANNEGVKNDISGGDGTDIVTVTTRGGSFTTTPTVAFSDGGSGSGAEAVYESTWTFSELAWSSDIPGYSGTENIRVFVGIVGTQRGETTTDTLFVEFDPDRSSGSEISADNDTIRAATLDLDELEGDIVFSVEDNSETAWTTDATLDDYDALMTNESGALVSGDDLELLVTSTFIRLTGSDTTDLSSGVTVSTVFKGFVIDAEGSNYSDPSVTFTASTGTAPVVAVNTFATQWGFTIADHGSGFSTVPEAEDMTLTGTQHDGVNQTESFELGNIEVLNSSGSSLEDDDFAALLTVDGDSLILANGSASSFRTTEMSLTAPSLTVSGEETFAADLYMTTASFNDDGEPTTSLNGGVAPTGDALGKGYTEEISVSLNARTVSPTVPSGYTLAIAPSESATVTLTGFTTDAITKEVSWDAGANTITGGAGYVTNINAAASTTNTAFTISNGGTNNVSTAITVTAGGTYTVDADYGTGERAAEFEGDDSTTGN